MIAKPVHGVAIGEDLLGCLEGWLPIPFLTSLFTMDFDQTKEHNKTDVPEYKRDVEEAGSEKEGQDKYRRKYPPSGSDIERELALAVMGREWMEKNWKE